MNIVIYLLIAGVIVITLVFFAFLKKRKNKPEFTDEEYDKSYEDKKNALEKILGPMHELVGHAIIGFQIGGPLDMYYFNKGIPGTGFASMELIEPDGSGPKSNRIGTYEIVAFTKLEKTDHKHGDKYDENSPFDKIELRLRSIMTTMANYSYNCALNPCETGEIPGDDGEPNTCLIFDDYTPDGKQFEINEKRHCLLLCMEVHPSEMHYARENGTAKVIQMLKDAGHYPYSDLDRPAVC